MRTSPRSRAGRGRYDLGTRSGRCSPTIVRLRGEPTARATAGERSAAAAGERGVVDVPHRAGGVERRRVGLVLRVLAGPALDEVRVGDDGATHSHGLGVRIVDQLHGLL